MPSKLLQVMELTAALIAYKMTPTPTIVRRTIWIDQVSIRTSTRYQDHTTIWRSCIDTTNCIFTTYITLGQIWKWRSQEVFQFLLLVFLKSKNPRTWSSHHCLTFNSISTILPVQDRLNLILIHLEVYLPICPPILLHAPPFRLNERQLDPYQFANDLFPNLRVYWYSHPSHRILYKWNVMPHFWKCEKRGQKKYCMILKNRSPFNGHSPFNTSKIWHFLF